MCLVNQFYYFLFVKDHQSVLFSGNILIYKCFLVAQKLTFFLATIQEIGFYISKLVSCCTINCSCRQL